MKPETRGVPWLTVEEAARHLGFKKKDGSPSVRAFYVWLQRAARKPKVHRLGRRLRFRQTDLDACVEVQRDDEQRLRLVR